MLIGSSVNQVAKITDIPQYQWKSPSTKPPRYQEGFPAAINGANKQAQAKCLFCSKSLGPLDI